MFAPTWKVTINGSEEAFFYALAAKPQYLNLNENNFIQTTSEEFEKIMDGNDQNVITNANKNSDE
ncbi:hypothetical protein MUO14_11455 [Halobacillus shinanisalinarum]|uniref:Uncharacterized protein n=1 Tax=Halobacillus shinanisalinarum TaxID=2932258 RepID=A0ABY4H588_9BACI|nr:hypothetical protein [Halobacillus shinanisalinarum]UOQ95479.1 hypothetical protein MUO14_11455 [Halobacillus shinanisalinarum]